MHDIFYFTDIHGMYDLYRAIIDWCDEQDPEATIIFGGDACDRGPDGYKIMKELLENPQVCYLKGNHEDMFVKAARFILNNYKGIIEEKAIKEYLYALLLEDYCPTQIANCVYNGGLSTLVNWMLDGMSNNFVTKINKLPLTFSYENLDFCHAGSQYKIFKRVANDEYENEIPDLDDETSLLWDRNCIGLGWAPNRICIYGHTPVYHLPAKYYCTDKSYANAHPCKYVGHLDDRLTGAKIAMDVGTANSNKLYVLNCLTMNVQGFKYINKENEEYEIKKIECIQM